MAARSTSKQRTSFQRDVTDKINLFGLMTLIALAIGVAATLSPSATRTRGALLQGLAIAAAVAIAVLGALGLASSIDGLPNHRATLLAKIVGGIALMLVPVFRLRSIRRGMGQVLNPESATGQPPFSFRQTRERSDRKGRARHLGAARTVRNASIIETVLLMAAVAVAVILMRQ